MEILKQLTLIITLVDNYIAFSHNKLHNKFHNKLHNKLQIPKDMIFFLS